MGAPMHSATAQSLAMAPTKWQDLWPPEQILVSCGGYLNSAVFTPGTRGQSYSQERVSQPLNYLTKCNISELCGKDVQVKLTIG